MNDYYDVWVLCSLDDVRLRVIDGKRAGIVCEEGGVFQEPRGRLRHLDVFWQRALGLGLATRRLDVRRNALHQALKIIDQNYNTV